MLIQNVSNMAQASPPVRLASNGTPDAVVAAPPNVEAKPAVVAEQPAVNQQAERQPSAAQLQNQVDTINQALLDTINQALKQSNKNLEFSVDESTDKSVVKLVDTETGDVIRQFPSEEALAISRAIDQFQQGLLLKQEA